MLDDQLAASVEQIGQGAPAARGLERVRLVHPHPRQGAPLRGQFIAQPRLRLLALQQRAAPLEPGLPRYHFMAFHRCLHSRLLATGPQPVIAV